ncbi:hypothetical protein C8F01DRAFT_1147103 [Mycena amicta]|nr:hypothetical protein C8F01DRAFT_1147103 [Mycena amicta]
MRDLAAHHPTLEDRTRWAVKADELEKAPDGEKEHILMDIGKGLGLIIALPFILAGGILYGVGLFVKGVGNILTGGIMRDAVG